LHFYAPKDKLPRVIIATAKQHKKLFGMYVAIVFIQHVYIFFLKIKRHKIINYLSPFSPPNFSEDEKEEQFLFVFSIT